jgi:hypothetical protein
MRWIFRLVVLGLAGYGAYRLYELLQPRAAELRDTAGSQMHQVADTARGAVDDVREDLRSATQQLKDDVGPVVDEAARAARTTADQATAGSTSPPVPSTP